MLFNALSVIIVQKGLPSQFHVQLARTKTKLARVLAKTVQLGLIAYKDQKTQQLVRKVLIALQKHRQLTIIVVKQELSMNLQVKKQKAHACHVLKAYIAEYLEQLCKMK
jgi:hypothetical protein